MNQTNDKTHLFIIVFINIKGCLNRMEFLNDICIIKTQLINMKKSSEDGHQIVNQ